MKRLNKYVIFILILGLIPILWFVGRDSDVLINGVDTNFPLNPVIWFLRRFYIWNNIPNAGSDFSSSTAGIFFHFIQVLPYLLGIPLKIVQIFSFVFWFLLIIFSSYFFSSSIFKKSYFARIILVVFYSLNIYLFNTWENVKVSNLSLISAIPLGLSILILLNDKRINHAKALLLAAATGVVLSGAGINPAYFMCFFIIMFLYQFACILVSKQEKIRLLKNFLAVSFMIILVNTFWIIPTLNFLVRSVNYQGGLGAIGFTDWVSSLSENTSLLNVLRMQGAWDWYPMNQDGLPLYIPYALNYFRKLPFILFSFAIPLLAVVSFLVRDKKQKLQKTLFLSFAIMIIVGTFLGAGVHPPTGGIFFWLTKKIPFFSFFRSPWYIFTPLLVLSYSTLIAFLYINMRKFSKRITTLFFVVLLIGNFFYSYPLITGKIFRPTRQDSFFVKFPNYVFDSAKWLETATSGRIISYPDDEIENYKWGYRGIESILSLLSDRETLFAPLNGVDAPASQLLKSLYLSLRRNEIDIAKSIAYKLNAAYIFQKLDQNSITGGLSQEVLGWQKQNFGEWNFYQIPYPEASKKIFTAQNILFGYPHERANETIRVLRYDEHLVNPQDSQVNQIPKVGEIAGKVIAARNLQVKSFEDFAYLESKLSNRLAEQRLDKAEFVFEIPHEGEYAPALEKYNLEKFGINPQETLSVKFDQDVQIWMPKSVNESFVYYETRYFSKGEHRVTIDLKNPNLISGGNFEGEVDFEKSGYGDGELSYEIRSEENNKYLSVHNLNRAQAAATFRVNSFDPLYPYLIRLRYKQIYGNNLVVYASQEENTLYKVQTERLPNYPEWRSFNFYFEPVKVNSKLKINLSAPFVNDPLGTKALFDDLEVYEVFANQLVFVQRKPKTLANPKVDFKMLSPSHYTADVSGDQNGQNNIIIFAENYSPSWGIELFTNDGQKIKSSPLHFAVDMYSNGWYIKDAPASYRAVIIYKGQGMFQLSAVISVIVFAGAVVYFIVNRKKNNVES